MCSEAMIWGMPYESFWHCSWTEYCAYRRKFQLESRKRSIEADEFAWWQGRYFAEALISVYPFFNGFADAKKSPKFPYPKSPHLAQETRTEEDKEKLQRTTTLIQEHNLMMRAKIQAAQKGMTTDAPPEM